MIKITGKREIYLEQSLADGKVTHISGIGKIFVDNQTTHFGAWAVLFRKILLLATEKTTFGRKFKH